MSIEEARDRLATQRVVALMREAADGLETLLDARLSPAPVGGETESFSAMAARLIREADIIHDMNQRRAPTPPPAEPDGGEANWPTWLYDKCGRTMTPETAQKIADVIADLEQRLAEAEATLAERDRRIAVLEEGKDWPVEASVLAGRILSHLGYKVEASMEPGIDRRRDQIAALISPATDKGGE